MVWNQTHGVSEVCLHDVNSCGAVNSKFGKLLLLNFSILERVFCITDYSLMGIEMKWN